MVRMMIEKRVMKTECMSDPVVEEILEKYNIPKWTKPYICEYIGGWERNPVTAIKHAVSFIETGRKKGEVTKSHVKLPNGVTFETPSITRLLGAFLYGEERLSQIYREWSAETAGYGHAQYPYHFGKLAEMDEGHARAIKNIIDGFGKREENPSEAMMGVFDYIGNLREWEERAVATNILLKHSYTFIGQMLYRAFYRTSSEFMRSLGKAFDDDEDSEWLVEEARRIVAEGRIPRDRLRELSEEVLSRVMASVNAEGAAAESHGIEKEIELLGKISIAHPLHNMNGMGASFDVDSEIKRICESSERFKAISTKI